MRSCGDGGNLTVGGGGGCGVLEATTGKTERIATQRERDRTRIAQTWRRQPLSGFLFSRGQSLTLGGDWGDCSRNEGKRRNNNNNKGEEKKRLNGRRKGKEEDIEWKKEE